MAKEETPAEKVAREEREEREKKANEQSLHYVEEILKVKVVCSNCGKPLSQCNGH